MIRRFAQHMQIRLHTALQLCGANFGDRGRACRVPLLNVDLAITIAIETAQQFAMMTFPVPQQIAHVTGFVLAEHRSLAAEHAERRSEEHTSELQSLMRISYAVFCLKKKKNQKKKTNKHENT